MDHAEIAERQIVDRYLMGRLSESEVERFEDHYLGCEACTAELEMAERLQAAARHAASEDSARLQAARGLAVFAWLVRRGSAVQAAVLAVLVLLPAAALLRPGSAPPAVETPPRVESPAVLPPAAGTPIISLRPQRDGATDGPPSLQLDLPDAPRWLVLSVELEPPLATAYRVVLHRDDEELWRAEGLEPGAAGKLNVSLHSSFLPAGDYLLVVEAEPGLLVSRNAFRVSYLAG